MPNKIKEFIRSQGLTIEEFAKKCDVSLGSARSWYTRSNVIPKPDRIEKICAVFGCTEADLVKGNAVTQHRPFKQTYTHLDPTERIILFVKERRIVQNHELNDLPYKWEFTAAVMQQAVKQGRIKLVSRYPNVYEYVGG